MPGAISTGSISTHITPGIPADFFLPTDIPNLVGWWRADAINGVADGGAVSTWPDSSPAALNLVQDTGSLQPVWIQKPSGLNGQPTVRFTSDRIVASYSTNLTAFSIYAAIIPTGSTFREIMNKSSSAGQRNFYFVLRETTDLLTIGFTNAADTYNDTNSVAAVTDGAAAIVGGTWDGTTLLNDLNGTEATTSPVVTPQLVGSSLYVGDLFTGGAEYYAQDISEIILYSVGLTASQRSLVRRYLGIKYGVTVS